jgi:hypothetical protein
MGAHAMATTQQKKRRETQSQLYFFSIMIARTMVILTVFENMVVAVF